ncbi:MAG: peroxide stress protein YaaA [Bacteroidetes bacterium]|nr:peroxide stress protein YaaA [Bacteroidota bacterium]
MGRSIIDDRFTVLAASANFMASGGNPFAPDVFDYRSKTTFNYFHQLIPDRREIMDQLLQAIQQDETAMLEDIFGADNVSLGIDLTTSAYSGPLMAARKRFAPDPFYSAVDFEGLPTGAQRRLLENSVIISGLFGLLRPDDLIPEYSLNISATVPEIGLLSSYWKPKISPFLNQVVQNKFVWDLLPESHQDTWDDNESYDARATINFYNHDGSVIEDDMVYLGQMMNFIVRGPAINIEALDDWKHPAGFKFSIEKSNLEGKRYTLALVPS